MIQNLSFKLTLFFGSGKEGVGGGWAGKCLSEISLSVYLNFFLSNYLYPHMVVKREASGVIYPGLSPSSGIY